MAWTAFPQHDDAWVYSAAELKQAWPQLHLGDCEPFPKKAALVDAWIAFHAGDFARAARLGLDVGVEGYSVAHKATCIYANYLEPNERKKFALFEEVAERCDRHQLEQPDNPAGYYWQAYALGRYAQGISIVKALAQGIAPKVRAGLDKAIRLAPAHADACIALGAYQAEIIATVGALIAGLTYGARKDDSYKAFQKGLALDPESAIGRIEYGHAMLSLEGKKRVDEALALYRQAAAYKPQDATGWLDIEAARRAEARAAARAGQGGQ
jgi:tetratricopeptide (TPR) repeat protein